MIDPTSISPLRQRMIEDMTARGLSEVVKLKVKHIDSALGIIRIEQCKGRKDRHVMLSPECSSCCANGGRRARLRRRCAARGALAVSRAAMRGSR